MWEGRNINDSLPSEKKVAGHHKQELGFIYLVVIELQNLNYLGDDFQPHLTRIAQQEALKNCQLWGVDEDDEEEEYECVSGPPQSILEGDDASSVSSFVSVDRHSARR